MITGSVTRQGKYKKDDKDICELLISKISLEELPHKKGKKIIVILKIGRFEYEAGVHENQDGQVWISSVLHKAGANKEKVRLVDALESVKIYYQNKIRIVNEGHVYHLYLANA